MLNYNGMRSTEDYAYISINGGSHKWCSIVSTDEFKAGLKRMIEGV